MSLTAAEVCRKIGFGICPDDLLRWAQSGYAPHIRVGDSYFFKFTETRSWVLKNIAVHSDGKPLPAEVIVLNVQPDMQDLSRVPTSLSMMKEHLLHWPLSSDMPAIVSGVYFLCDGNEVVYVGQAKCVAVRVPQHVNRKTFDRVYFMRVPEWDLDLVETKFIVALSPKYNRSKVGHLVTPRSPERLGLTA
jgi:hypothetical protein